MRENKREATVFALDKVLPSSHPPCLPPHRPHLLSVSLPSNTKGTSLCNFLILVPLLSLSFPSVSETKMSVTFSDFVCLFPSTAFISLSSAALHISDIRLSPAVGLVPHCICHHNESSTTAPVLLSPSLTFHAVTLTLSTDPFD